MSNTGFTHIDKTGKPSMVDVGEKAVTRRAAVAQAIVEFPEAVFKLLQEQGQQSKKGPVIDTAIIAGVMGGKRTHELIPFCHPLPIESCNISIETDAANHRLLINAETKVTHKTGVEMEALTAASVAALTIYDMCKALSHDIVIKDIRLLSKSGGKSDFAGEQLP